MYEWRIVLVLGLEVSGTGIQWAGYIRFFPFAILRDLFTYRWHLFQVICSYIILVGGSEVCIQVFCSKMPKQNIYFYAIVQTYWVGVSAISCEAVRPFVRTWPQNVEGVLIDTKTIGHLPSLLDDTVWVRDWLYVLQVCDDLDGLQDRDGKRASRKACIYIS